MLTLMKFSTLSNINVNFIFNTAFHTCKCLQKSNSANREAKFMVKIMKGSANTKKRHWFDNGQEKKGFPETSKVESLGTTGGGKPNSRRRTVLNKLFMKNISEQMACDEITSNRGIQITRIRVNEDLRGVNVYWLCDSKVPGGAFLPTLLDNYAHTLRHNLSQLGHIGKVPQIRFVADKQLALGENVDRLLINIDTGGEELTLPNQYSLQEDWKSGDTLPAMRNNILGIDQEEIMAKVKRVMKKQSSKEQLLSMDNISAMSHIEEINAEIAKFREQHVHRKHKSCYNFTHEHSTVQQDWIEDLEDEGQEDDYVEDEEPEVKK